MERYSFVVVLFEEFTEDVGGFGLHAGEHVLVHVQGEAWAGVTQSFAHDLGWNARLQEQGGMRMAQIMKTDRRQLARKSAASISIPCA